MKRLLAVPVLGLICMGALASPAAAEVSGPWHVAGKIGASVFTLNCVFKPDGAHLGGVCTEASSNDPKVKSGRAHPLTAGGVTGDQVSWTYRTSFLLATFNVTFEGTQAGDRMSGAITVMGRKGDFTAAKE